MYVGSYKDLAGGVPVFDAFLLIDTGNSGNRGADRLHVLGGTVRTNVFAFDLIEPQVSFLY